MSAVVGNTEIVVSGQCAECGRLRSLWKRTIVQAHTFTPAYGTPSLVYTEAPVLLCRECRDLFDEDQEAAEADLREGRE